MWLMLLVTANVVTPLFFLRHVEATVVLGTDVIRYVAGERNETVPGL